MATDGHAQRIIIISGIRYNVNIRLDIPWSYGEESYHQDEAVPRDRVAVSTPGGARGFDTEIGEVRSRTEPWLYTERAPGERNEAIR